MSDIEMTGNPMKNEIVPTQGTQRGAAVSGPPAPGVAHQSCLGVLNLLSVCMALVALGLSIGTSMRARENDVATAAAATASAIAAGADNGIAELRGKMPLHFGQLVDLPTVGTRDSEWVHIDDELYLVHASDKDNLGVKEVSSQVWRFRRDTRDFELHQNIPAYSAHDVDAMVIGGDTYLCFASKSGKTNLYKWDSGSKQFVVHQELAENKYVRDVDHFRYVGFDWILLVVSERQLPGSSDKSNVADSELMKWDATTKQFAFVQGLPSKGARDGEFMVVEGVGSIAIANTKGDPYSSPPRQVDSYVYKWDASSGTFVDAQMNIPTDGNYDFDYFELETRCYDASTDTIKVENASFMASAFSNNGTSGVAKEIDSIIYKWHGWTGTTKGWQPYQRIPTMGARDVEFFQMPNDRFVESNSDDPYTVGHVAKGKVCPRSKYNMRNTYEYRHCINSFLAVSNLEHNNGDPDLHSHIYVWNMWSNKFEQMQAVPTFGVRDIDFVHDSKSDSYMLSTAGSKVAGADGTEYQIPSFVYETVGLRVPQLERAALEDHNLKSGVPACEGA